jgi:hypothetical protein
MAAIADRHWQKASSCLSWSQSRGNQGIQLGQWAQRRLPLTPWQDQGLGHCHGPAPQDLGTTCPIDKRSKAKGTGIAAPLACMAGPRQHGTAYQPAQYTERTDGQDNGAPLHELSIVLRRGGVPGGLPGGGVGQKLLLEGPIEHHQAGKRQLHRRRGIKHAGRGGGLRVVLPADQPRPRSAPAREVQPTSQRLELRDGFPGQYYFAASKNAGGSCPALGSRAYNKIISTVLLVGLEDHGTHSCQRCLFEGFNENTLFLCLKRNEAGTCMPGCHTTSERHLTAVAECSRQQAGGAGAYLQTSSHSALLRPAACHCSRDAQECEAAASAVAVVVLRVEGDKTSTCASCQQKLPS